MSIVGATPGGGRIVQVLSAALIFTLRGLHARHAVFHAAGPVTICGPDAFAPGFSRVFPEEYAPGDAWPLHAFPI